MADVILQITDVLSNIERLESNFKKQAKVKITSRFIAGRIEKLKLEYAKFSLIKKPDSDLVTVACNKVIEKYENVYNVIFNTKPFDKTTLGQKTRSADIINYLGLPEDLDEIKSKYFVIKQKYDEVNNSLRYLTGYTENCNR